MRLYRLTYGLKHRDRATPWTPFPRVLRRWASRIKARYRSASYFSEPQLESRDQ